MSNSSIPAGPSDISPEWLTSALREARAIQSARVIDVSAEIIGEDRGFTGIVARLDLRYDRPEPAAPSSVVAKFPLAQRRTASAYRESREEDPEQLRRYVERCAREVDFYRHATRHNDTAPDVYYAGADRDAGRISMLLQDLSDGEPGDAVHGCSVKQAELVIDQIASFHARWWDDPILDRFDWLPRWSGDPETRAERYRGQVGPFLEQYGDRVPEDVRELAVRLPDHYYDVLRRLDGPPVTMIHADLHLDNIIFVPDSGSQVAKLVDWQGVSRGMGVIDLSMFLVGSLDVTNRRSAEPDLLRRYHQILTESGLTGYSYDRLLDDYRLALLWQLAGTIGWLVRVDMASLEGRERALVKAICDKGQLFAALQDHEMPERIAALER